MKAAPWLGASLAALVPVVATSAADPVAPAPSGEALFAGKCAHCHDRSGWGTRALARRLPPDQAELLQRPAVPAALVRLAVRRGIGSMPPFTPTDLSDDELERLARWLEARR
jgi:mono/diheme cytochrome c family protein